MEDSIEVGGNVGTRGMRVDVDGKRFDSSPDS